MKEDIEYLEEEIAQSKELFEDYGEYGVLDTATMVFIENLIKAYKELEERNHYLVQERQQYEEMLFKSKEHYIEKDKIREKLNNINTRLENEDFKHDMYQGTEKYHLFVKLIGAKKILEELLDGWYCTSTFLPNEKEN